MERDADLGVHSTVLSFDDGRDSRDLEVADTLGAPAADPVPAGDATPLARHEAARYQLRGQLGEGGMGQVDRVWDVDLMRELAVKRLREDRRTDVMLGRQFLWEARVTASLDHPNIVPVHDLGLTPDGKLYFTMKRVAGVSLGTAISRLASKHPGTVAQLTLPRRLRIFLQICQAVAFAHVRGVLHRDLKPDNVMLGEHGEVLVMDWGLAVALPGAAPELVAASAGVLTNEALSGTPLYMAPEQAECVSDLDERADVFSLGAILYELCALQHAYDGKTPAEILEQVRRGEVRSLSKLASTELSPSLIAVTHKAMAFDRADRYASAAQLLADVELVLDGRTPQAEQASAMTRFGRYAVREDRRLGSLRPYQIDLVIGGAIIGGVGLGSMVPARFEGWGWLAITIGVAMCIPFMVVWIRTLMQR